MQLGGEPRKCKVMLVHRIKISRGLGGTRRIANRNDSVKQEEQTRRHRHPEPSSKIWQGGCWNHKTKIAKLEALSEIMCLVVACEQAC